MFNEKANNFQTLNSEFNQLQRLKFSIKSVDISKSYAK